MGRDHKNVDHGTLFNGDQCSHDEVIGKISRYLDIIDIGGTSNGLTTSLEVNKIELISDIRSDMSENVKHERVFNYT